MSSQASSAGHGEKEVRQKIVETGDVDVMISIRSNFFYTRTVPCELWFFDRSRPVERRDQVLMLDARNVYRKVTRKIYDFSPEQQANLTAIVWLYRGQQDRFLGLVKNYIGKTCTEADTIAPALALFETTLNECRIPSADFCDALADVKEISDEQKQPLIAALAELTDTAQAYVADRARLAGGLAGFNKTYQAKLPADNARQHAARQAFDPLAEGIKGLVKQVDLLYKQAARATQLAHELSGIEEAAEFFDRKTANKLIKRLDDDRKVVVERLKSAAYFHRQIVWLQDRFPKAEFAAVAGLCKAVSRAESEAADWSLTPGRYAGVAPAEVDEEFDFELALRDIHVELADLNTEAIDLAARIQQNFSELGI
jgi:type I restriction enzyme M protein